MTFHPEPTDTVCDEIQLDICDGIRDDLICLKKLSKYGLAVFNQMETILESQEELPTNGGVGNENGDRFVDWGEQEIGDAPPEPIFNTNDLNECRVVVNRKYTTAVQTAKDAETNEKRIQVSYQRILALQTEYGVNLARN